ncbi:MAG TPA: hypothetical protein VK541_04315 [Pedobacter sp.]|uniref:hypothetical protein n=1 Tax=Pedobacter sp. TaxID=1411316 RepID=UPI002C87DEAB|nr:hypothetical protein [Pedobacter sp.]HMI01680.1 hypothetical protein [Pedobacter sp.]
MNFKNALVKTLVLVVLLFQGCSKKNSGPDEPEEKPVPLAKLKSVRPPDGPGGIDYYYNSNGRIDKVETRSGSDLMSVHDFVYKDGIVMSLNVSTPPPPRWKDPLEPYFKQIYKYSGNQIVEVLIEKLGPQPREDNSLVTLTYDSRGFIKTKKMEFLRSGGIIELVSIDRLTTDDKGNVTKIERDHYVRGALAGTSVELREYDNKINPLYKLVSPTNIDEYFNPNNRVKNTGFDQYGNPYPTVYEYEYNAEGLPVKQTTKTALQTFDLLFDYYK